MTQQDKYLAIAFAMLAAALKKVPGRKIEVEINDWDLERHWAATGPEDVRIITITNPTNPANRIYRVMLQGDYEAWLKEQDKPKGRKMYLEK